MMCGFYSGGLLDYWPIMMLFYTNVVLLFSLRGLHQLSSEKKTNLPQERKGLMQ